jgi:uncharacterized protein YheU (UPF0270 family)
MVYRPGITKLIIMSLVIPHRELSPDTLVALLEEFVTREGTEYGEYAVTTASKVEEVRRQLESGRACIVYDPEQTSLSVVPSEYAQTL